VNKAVQEILIKLGLDPKDFERGAAKVKKQTVSLSDTIRSAGTKLAAAFSAGAVIAYSKSLLQWADSIQTVSDRTGLSIASVVKLKDAAIKSNLSLDEATQIYVKMSNAQDEAARGNKQVIDGFAKLGISLNTVVNTPADEFLKMVGTRAESTAGSMGILGDIIGDRVGVKGVAMLKELASSAKEVDLATTEAIAKAAKLQDQMELLGDSIKSKTLGALYDLIKGLKEYDRYAGKPTLGKSIMGVLNPRLSDLWKLSGIVGSIDRPSAGTGQDLLAESNADRKAREEARQIAERRQQDAEKVKAEVDKKAADEKDKAEKEASELLHKVNAELLEYRSQLQQLDRAEAARVSRIEKDIARQSQARSEVESERDKAISDLNIAGTAPEVSSLQRVGGFMTKAGVVSGMTIADKQLKVAEETAKITRDYLPKLAEIDMEIKALREEMAR
jgi:hypothetical protein